MDVNKFTTTILEHYLLLTRHTQPPAIRNNQDSQFPEVSWLETALLISFTFLRPGTKSAFQVKGKGFAFCERHTVSSRSYLRLRLHASHNISYSFMGTNFSFCTNLPYIVKSATILMFLSVSLPKNLSYILKQWQWIIYYKKSLQI